VKDGKVMYFIPPPVPPDPKMQPPIGIVVGGDGAIYAASDDQKDIKKYVRTDPRGPVTSAEELRTDSHCRSRQRCGREGDSAQCEMVHTARARW
jgi:hypothetical protein